MVWMSDLSTFLLIYHFSMCSFQGTIKILSVNPTESNGDEGIRTPDPLLARQVLSQLSYTPVGNLAATYFPTPSPVQYHRPLRS